MSSRFVSSSMQARAEESLVAFRILANIGVTSGSVYFCTGKQYINASSMNPNTYTPVGGLGSIEPIQEESDVFPRDVRMRLCGVNTVIGTGSLSLYEPLRESMNNREVFLYRAFMDPTTFTVVETPELMWSGRTRRVEVRPEEGEYELTVANEIRTGAKAQYFNRETFRAIDSSDTGGDWIDQIALFKSNWGGQSIDFQGRGVLDRNPVLRSIAGRFGYRG